MELSLSRLSSTIRAGGNPSSARKWWVDRSMPVLIARQFVLVAFEHLVGLHARWRGVLDSLCIVSTRQFTDQILVHDTSINPAS
jgi:hypothetical protein